MRALGISIVSVILAVALLAGCNDPFGGDSDGGPGYRAVQDTPTETVAIDALVAEQGPDPELYLRVNRSGYEVREYPVNYRGLDYYDLMIVLENPEDITVGHGDSGSPIVDGAGRVVAALYAGDPTNKELFFARPIEDMTRELLENTGSAVASAADREREETRGEIRGSQGVPGRELLVARHFVGIGGETLRDIRGSLGFPEEEWITRRERPTPSRRTEGDALSGRQVDSAIAGQSILVRYLDGNIFRSYVSGTISYTSGNLAEGGSILAFGHGVLGDGASSVPVDLVPAVGFVESYRYPYKVVDPFAGEENSLGFLVEEAYSGAAVRQSGGFDATVVESSFLSQNATVALGAQHLVAPTSRSTQDHYFQTMAILSPLIYEWESAYNQAGDLTVRFGSFATTGGTELATEAGGISGVLEEPLTITHEEYLAAEDYGSYLGYIVETVYEVVREAYRSREPGTRFARIQTELSVTD